MIPKTAMILAFALVFQALGFSGIAVSARWTGKNENLYGGWGKIYRHTIVNDKVAQSQVVFDGSARFATINQTGTLVAFIQSNGQISMVPVDGGAVTDLVKVGSGKGYLDWPQGDWLYYSHGGYGESGSREFYRVNVKTKLAGRVTTFNTNMWLWSLSADGKRASLRPEDNDLCSGTGHVYPWNVGPSGNLTCNSSFRSCGNAISADGQVFCMWAHADYTHTKVEIRDFSTLALESSFNVNDMNGWGENMGTGFNRTRWSANSNKWICFMQGWDGRAADQGANMVLYNWQDKKQVVLTNSPKGSQIQNEAGDFWEGTLTEVATRVSARNTGPFGLTAFPNPFHRETRFYFQGLEAGSADLEISLFDPRGRHVGRWTQKQPPPFGVFRPDRLEPGLYLVKGKLGNKTASTRLSCIR